MVIVSNIPNLRNSPVKDLPVEYEQLPARPSLGWLLACYWKLAGKGCFLHNMMGREVYLLALLKIIFFFRPVPLVVMDIILPIPRGGLRESVKLLVRRVLLRQVDVFINYARDTEGFERIYRIRRERFVYVPFKINNWSAIEKQIASDEGYIFVGGQTRRDFDTLLAALEGSSYPVRVVTPNDRVLMENGTYLPADRMPSNVTLVRDATTPDRFVPQIAGARLVVLPIVKENISPSGIGVSIQCMALGKCVIISTGPSANDVLEHGVNAIIVPASDPVALRREIDRLWNDDALRGRIGEAAYQYARALGHEDRLHKDCVEIAYDVWQKDIPKRSDRSLSSS